MTGQSIIQHWFQETHRTACNQFQMPPSILHTPYPSNLLCLITLIFGDEYKLQISPPPVTSSLVQIFPSAPCCQTPSVYVLPTICETQFHSTENTQNYGTTYFLSFFIDSNRDTQIHAMNGCKHSSNNLLLCVVNVAVTSSCSPQIFKHCHIVSRILLSTFVL
jgi:hypothetical protein